MHALGQEMFGFQLPHKGVLDFVYRVDFEFEEILVSKSLDLALYRLDLVVRPLHRASREHHVVIRRCPRAVPRQCPAPILEHPLARTYPSVKLSRPEARSRTSFRCGLRIAASPPLRIRPLPLVCSTPLPPPIAVSQSC